jgi:hypothetical protein
MEGIRVMDSGVRCSTWGKGSEIVLQTPSGVCPGMLLRGAEKGGKMVRLVGLEPTTGKSPADFKPAAYANFATAAPGVYAAETG